MPDSMYLHCNKTELIGICRRQGLGVLTRTLDVYTLAQVASGELTPTPEMFSGTNETRKSLAQYLGNPRICPDNPNWPRVQSQLPGCDGVCTEFPCTEARHALCFLPNKGGL